MKLSKSLRFYKSYINNIAGPSTFGKSIDQFSNSSSPAGIKKAKGSYTWDLDGNKYIDTIMALGSVFIGHSNTTINNAIKKQLSYGINLSLASELELELAENIIKLVPSAEYVRFGKNGNDVTTAAVRLARHTTKKNHILFCGYHSWQDWYVCKTSMNSGVPEDIGKYSHRFDYNDLNSLKTLLKKYKDDVACIILEPVSKFKPICHKKCDLCPKKCMGFLKGVKKLSKKYASLLIFDEVVTGFRFDLGGYQKISNIKPDLSCFSKAMANGMPISALVGSKKIMSKSNEIFYSLTYGGEALSLAASIATIKFLKREGVCEIVGENGSYFINEFRNLINNNSLSDVISIIGFPHKSILLFNDYNSHKADEIRTLWIKLMTSFGVLNSGYFIFSFAHDKKIINLLLRKINSCLKNLKIVIEKNNKILDKNEKIAQKAIRDIL